MMQQSYPMTEQKDIQPILKNKKYVNIAFEGGGVLGCAHIGSLKKLEPNGFLKHLSRFAGSSSGSLVATLLACGSSIANLETAIYNIDFSKFKDSDFFVKGLYRLYNQYGFYHGDSLLATIELMLESCVHNKFITFQQLYDLNGNTLIITGSNLDKKVCTLFHRKSFPDMPISLAIRISVSYPFYFTSVKFNDCIYVDGGLFNNFPLNDFDEFYDENTDKCDIFSETIGLKFINDDVNPNLNNPISNLKEFSEAFIFTILDNALKSHVSRHQWDHIIKIYVGTIRAMDFGITIDQKKWLDTQGQIAASTFISASLL